MAARLSSMERPAASQFVCARRKDWLQRVISACVLRTAARALLRLTFAVLTASAAFCVLFCSAVFCPASFLTSCTEARYSVLSASRLARAAMVAEVAVAQCRGKSAHLLRGGDHLCLKRFLGGSGVGEALGIVALPGKALLQLVVGGGKRALVLRDGLLLKREPPLKRGQLRTQPLRALLEALHARGGEAKLALRFSDLLLDRADVAGKVVRLKRQGHHQVAEGFAHLLSPANRIKRSGHELPLNFGLNLTVNTGILRPERS